MVQFVALAAVFHTHHVAESTPVVIDCVLVVAMLPSVPGEWALSNAVAVP